MIQKAASSPDGFLWCLKAQCGGGGSPPSRSRPLLSVPHWLEAGQSHESVCSWRQLQHFLESPWRKCDGPSPVVQVLIDKGMSVLLHDGGNVLDLINFMYRQIRPNVFNIVGMMRIVDSVIMLETLLNIMIVQPCCMLPTTFIIHKRIYKGKKRQVLVGLKGVWSLIAAVTQYNHQKYWSIEGK